MDLILHIIECLLSHLNNTVSKLPVSIKLKL